LFFNFILDFKKGDSPQRAQRKFKIGCGKIPI
jgi:hypothetical protein